MQYYKNISNGEYLRSAHEMTVKENAEDERKAKAALNEAAINRADAEKEYIDFMREAAEIEHKSGEFFSRVKTTLLSEAINKIYTESLCIPLDKNMKIISKNLINNFIHENGTQKLLSTFRTKNLLLSEVNRIVTKYYNKIVEECNENCKENNNYCDFAVPDDIKDNFLDEIQDLDCDEASKLIKERVADSITQFMDSNALAKLEYEELLGNVQDHIDNMKDTDPNAVVKAQESATYANRCIQEMEMRREKNIFHCIVQKLAEAAIKDDKLKAIYTEGSKINMDKIVDHAQLYATLLEMANTTEMITINEEYMNNFIKSLS